MFIETKAAARTVQVVGENQAVPATAENEFQESFFCSV